MSIRIITHPLIFGFFLLAGCKKETSETLPPLAPVAGCRDDGTGNRAGIVVGLPNALGAEWPSAEVLNVVNAVGVVATQSDRRQQPVTILSRNLTLATFAKVILHSYGFSDISLDFEVPDSCAQKAAKVEIAGSLSEASQLRLTQAGAILSIIPSIPTQREGVRPTIPEFQTVLIVLGNEPIDATTPTVDQNLRVLKAVEYAKANPGCLLLFTGGKTAGPLSSLSEAKMMALVALSRGLPKEQFLLDEEAMSTIANATNSARLLEGKSFRHIFVVSKPTHLDWAMPAFTNIPYFAPAVPLAANVDKAEIVAQMQAYLRTHENGRIRHRMESVRDGISGTD